MVGVCCGCIAKPASVQPRKTYNTLVGQLFAGEPIRTDEEIDSSMRRKIQKIQEYVQVNPAKIPKVSRRLMRRIKATLLRPGNNLGFVKIAVHTYIYLLARSTDEVSSYSPSFFAREIVSGPDAVVPMLLKDMHIEMRTLGAELLAVFTRVQSQVDNKLDAIQAHIPQVCRAAQSALSADRKEQKLQETAERRRQGDKLAVPNPLDLVARRDPAHVAALEVACLRSLSELVALCRRNKVLPKHLSAIQAVMLDNLRVKDRGMSSSGSEGLPAPETPSTTAGSTAGVSAAAAAAGVADSVAGSVAGSTTGAGVAEIPSVVDTACYHALGIQGGVPSGSHPKQLAAQLLSLMGSFTRDIATVHTVLDSFYEYLDEKHRWQERSIVKELLVMLNTSGSQHQFPMYASLLRHASSKRLAVQDCAVVLGLAAEMGAALDDCYSLAALALALHEIPRAWAQQARRGPRTMPMQAFLDLLRVGPPRDAHPQTVLTGGPADSPPAAMSSPTDAAAAAAAAADTLPPTSSVGSTAPGDVKAFKQQLSQLKEALFAAVRLLAMRVGTAAELCEAVAGALSAAAAELGLAGHQAGGSMGGTGAASLLSGLLASVGSGGGAPASGGNAAAIVLEPAASGQVQDVSEAAAAVMMLQCTAVATEAVVAQCKSGGSSTAQQHQLLLLPGGVLPASVAVAAVPLLKAQPALIRRPVQRILLALLPGAPKGLSSDKLAGDLAEATLQELRRALYSDSTAAGGSASGSGGELLMTASVQTDEVLPARIAAVDSLLRACLAGPQGRPTATLQVARLLLQQQAQWIEYGYKAAADGSASAAHAVLLMANSQMAALAEATGSSELLAHQLPLDPGGCAGLQLTSKGLQATGVPSNAAASEAAIAALQQQQPATEQQGQALRDALVKAPRLVAEYGGQLQQLLEEHLASRRSTASDRAGDKPQLAEKVNALLTKRMSTLRRDLLHVSELMRDSMSINIVPASSITGSTRVSDPGSMPAAARLSMDTANVGGAAAGSFISCSSYKTAVSATGSISSVELVEAPGSAAGSSSKLALNGPAGQAPLPDSGSELPSPVAAQQGLTGVAGIADLADASPDAATSQTETPQLQQDAAVSPDGIALQGLKQQQQQQGKSKLSAAVARALQEPIPAGAYVVRDVKISRLAGELEPVVL